MNYIEKVKTILDKKSNPQYDIMSLYFMDKKEHEKSKYVHDDTLPLFNINRFGKKCFQFADIESVMNYFSFEVDIISEPIIKKESDNEIVIIFDSVILKDINDELSFLMIIKNDKIIIKNITKRYSLDFYLMELNLAFPLLFLYSTKQVTDLISEFLYPLIRFRDKYSSFDKESFINDIVVLYNNGENDFDSIFNAIGGGGSLFKSLDPIIKKLNLI